VEIFPTGVADTYTSPELVEVRSRGGGIHRHGGVEPPRDRRAVVPIGVDVRNRGQGPSSAQNPPQAVRARPDCPAGSGLVTASVLHRRSRAPGGDADRESRIGEFGEDAVVLVAPSGEHVRSHIRRVPDCGHCVTRASGQIRREWASTTAHLRYNRPLASMTALGISKGARMLASSSRLPLSVIVARLSAAGCVFAEDEARLLAAAGGTSADLDAMVQRRAAGEPLEHVLGWAEFCGLRIAVDAGVFVPRHRTEFLVREAVALVRAAGPADHTLPGKRTVVVDLCCGSGAVGAALVAALQRIAALHRVAALHRIPALHRIELHAADRDAAAVRCALRNVGAGGGHVYQGDLYGPLPAMLRGRVDILVANAPYVPTDAIGLLPPEARIHEPRVALDGGADGLEVLRRVIEAASLWLAPGGHLLVETSERQAPETVEAFARNGLIGRVASSAEHDATVVIGSGSSFGAPPALALR
jgi:release factor glutamine methyltransferase